MDPPARMPTMIGKAASALSRLAARSPFLFGGARLLLLSLLLQTAPGTIAAMTADEALRHAAAGAVALAPQEARLVEAMRRGGVSILVRHSATEPGTGDPPGFKLTDCATQRNLSDTGRGQARRLGQWFEANGIRPTTVRASPWCRTRETATLAFGRSEDWAALSNLLKDRSREEDHRGQVREAIANAGADAIDVFVSHGVSISAFVDVYLQQGEMVVVRPVGAAGVEVLGRLLVP